MPLRDDKCPRSIISVRGPIPADAFTDLLREHRLEAYLFAVVGSELPSAEDRADAVQESLIAIARVLAKGGVLTDLFGYAAATGRRKARDIRVKQSRWLGLDCEVLRNFADRSCSHEEDVEFEERLTIALDLVSDAVRRAFMMVFFEGKRPTEVAQVLGCWPGSVSRWLRDVWAIMQRLSGEIE